jgi:putative membrane protein
VQRPKRRLRDYATITLKGVVMGAADVIPGVSGGTMALILGLYRELITSLGAITSRPTLRSLAAGELGSAWRTIGGPFLLALALGIATAVIALSGVIVTALESAQSTVFALFFGLILASAVAVVRRIPRWGVGAALTLALGAAVGLWLVGLTPTTPPTTPAFLALSGALAICALVLPGISGAFILVLLGKYGYVLGAISTLDLARLLPVAVGGVIGLLSFTRLLAWLLARAEALTLSLLAGFMLGSLRKVWPWQTGGEELSSNLPPPDAGAALLAIGVAAVGAALVMLLDRLSQRTAA